MGISISNDLKWNAHIDALCNKAATRIYFLKQLKRAGLQHGHLLHFFKTVIRSVLEYAAPVWHYRLTKAQSERLEAIQKRALRIIYTCTQGMPYQFALIYAGVESLHVRREHFSKEFLRAFAEMTAAYITFYRLLAILLLLLDYASQLCFQELQLEHTNIALLLITDFLIISNLFICTFSLYVYLVHVRWYLRFTFYALTVI